MFTYHLYLVYLPFTSANKNDLVHLSPIIIKNLQVWPILLFSKAKILEGVVCFPFLHFIFSYFLFLAVSQEFITLFTKTTFVKSVTTCLATSNDQFLVLYFLTSLEVLIWFLSPILPAVVWKHLLLHLTYGVSCSLVLFHVSLEAPSHSPHLVFPSLFSLISSPIFICQLSSFNYMALKFNDSKISISNEHSLLCS